jgi:hypothetical protein
MLTLSDLSGHDPPETFHSYLTGYPLSGTGRYVLARTWYASEMPRAGSVWTHSLLLDDHVTELLPVCIADILSKFLRPKVPVGPVLSMYSEPLHLTTIGERIVLDERNWAFAAEIVSDLFGSSRSVVLASDSAAEVERLILALWLVQPLRLRNNFSFCTGSVALRGLGKRPFDLQVVPRQIWRSVARTATSEIAVFYNDHKNLSQESPTRTQKKARWQALLADHLVQPSDALLTFFDRFSVDVEASRQSLGRLAACAASLNDAISSGDAEILGREIARSFPGADGLVLKAALFGEKSRSGTSSLLDLSEFEKLKLLLTSDGLQSALAGSGLDVTDRSRRLFLPRPGWVPEYLRWLVECENLSAEAANLRRSLLEGLTAQQLELIHDEDRRLLIVILAMAPGLLYDRLLWGFSHEFQRSCFVAATTIGSIDLTRLFIEIVEAKAFQSAEDLVSFFGRDAVFALLGALVAISSAGPSLRWGAAFRNSEIAVTTWLSAFKHPLPKHLLETMGATGPALLDSAAEELCSRFARSLDTNAHASDLIVEEGWLDSLDLVSIACAVALRARTPTAIKVLLPTFSRVHSALLEEKLPGYCWDLFEPLPADSRFLWGWDRAERLRRILAHKFIATPSWPRSSLNAIVGESGRRRLAWFLLGSEEGRELLRQAKLDS